jgi:anti-anti-sigma factor
MVDAPAELPILVAVERVGDVGVVRLSGELDLAGIPLVRAAFGAFDGDVSRIVVDLADLEFIDSTGLTLTLQEQQRAHDSGRDFIVASVPHSVRRVFEIAGVAEHVRFAPDVRAAL